MREARAPGFEPGIVDPKSTALPLGHTRLSTGLLNRKHVAIITYLESIDKILPPIFEQFLRFSERFLEPAPL